jgi:2-keto-4-pentenoate hydratase/2-oxohepta-3-ene-1,7-dioic acid hydratase in catechol pathway
MEKYQIGTANLKGEKETVIVFCKGKHLDLLLLLNDVRFKKHFSAQITHIPQSLMEILEKWGVWKKVIPHLLEEVINDREMEERFLIDEADIQWRPPLLYPKKLICVGINYTDHIAEMGLKALPPRPYTFLKPATTTLVGTGEEVELPSQCRMVDWEAELAVVIGKKVRHVKGDEAMDCIAGYSVINDISARDWLAEPSLVGVDWVVQKAFDGFAPMGPYITPAEFVSDPQNLNISLTVNGVVKQNSNTSKMLFSVQQIIEHLSSIMTLEPGDVIATGTPAGVEYGRKDPRFLEKGDVMVVEIEGLGKLETKMV